MDQILLGPEVSFCRLNGRMAKQQLDLLKLAAGRAAQLRACATSVMGGHAGDADRLSVLPEHLPDDLFSQAFTRRAISTVHGAEQVAAHQSGRGGPPVNRDFVQADTGTVRMRPCLPTRSTMHQRPSRC